MQYVDVDFCTEVKRRCEKDEYTSANKITICHRFAEAAPRCVGETRRIRACVDRFEAPNREGARAPVMIDFWDAMAVCEERGKRLCYESEWVTACAPGVDIVSRFFDGIDVHDDGNAATADFRGWARWSGTSFSAPIVVAAIAREAAIYGITVAAAAERVVYDKRLLRMPGLGTVVNLH